MKYLVSMFVLVILASSTAIAIASATITAPTSLQTPGTLTVAGSSTVAPIAQEEITTFPSYWNGLVAANPAWGTTSALDISQVSLAGLGSGTAVPALAASSGGADVGEMSRPPSTGEYAMQPIPACNFTQLASTVLQLLLVQT